MSGLFSSQGAPNTTFLLGDIELRPFEIPEGVPFGGDQQTNVHQLPGGARIVDVMGPSDREITWSGIIFSFSGDEADARAQMIDGMRRAGQTISFTFWSHSYQVIIKSFQPVYERFYQVPYTITLIVVQDNNAPLSPAQQDSADNLVSSDFADVLTESQDQLGMTVPSVTPGPVSTFGGVQTSPSLDITAPATAGGVDLTALATTMSAARLALNNSSVSGLSPAALATMNGTITNLVAAAVQAQLSGDTQLEISNLTYTKGNSIANVFAGQSGSLNASALSRYLLFNSQVAPIMDVGNRSVRVVNNFNLENEAFTGNGDLTGITWDLAA